MWVGWVALALVLADGPPPRPAVHRAAVVTLHGEVDDTMLEAVKRRTADATAAGADLLIFDVDTYGGEAIAAMDIGDQIFLLPNVYTVAYVSAKAISAGALIAMSCNEIVMHEGTDLGDCEPIFASPTGGIETAPEKMQSPLRTKFRKYAERSGVPTALAEAMVTKELGVVRIRFEGEDADRFHYFASTEVDRWSADRRDRIAERETVLEPGRLLTVHADEAKRLGIARDVVKSREELLGLFGLAKSDDVSVYDESFVERLSRFLQEWKFLLFVIGVVGLYVEFKTPGFGVGGIVGIVALALFFGSAYVIELAQVWEIALFVVGLALLALEIFVIPGFGLAGILGIACLLVSFYAAGNRYFVPSPSRESYHFEMEQLRTWVLEFSASLLSIVVLAVLVSKLLPHVPMFRRLVLQPEAAIVAAGERTSAHRADGLPAPGDTGVAITKLRPAGKARFGEHRVDVTAEGDFVAEGEPVRVLEVAGNRVVVKREKPIA
jgi:membrane-bound serine protease (ClpP class)